VRFISPHAKHRIKLRDEIVEYLPGPHGTERREREPFVIAKFERAIEVGIHEHEVALGLDAFGQTLLRGMPSADPEIIETEGGRFVTTEGIHSPVYKLGLLDTEDPRHGWDEETRLFVERELLSRPEHGSDYLLAEAPSIAPPFPTWDEIRGRGQQTTPQLLARMVRDGGMDVTAAINYERAHQNRPEVLAALAELTIVGEPDGEIIAA
jgi:hypothetical protein